MHEAILPERKSHWAGVFKKQQKHFGM